MNPLNRTSILVIAVCLLLSIPALAQDENLWHALDQPGNFVLIRHALAPGTGDPENFDIEQCATQRNLSDAGREQARLIGELFRENGVSLAGVYTSQWCRCRDTAELLGLGEVRDLPALNSFFQNFQHKEPQTQELLGWLRADQIRVPVVLVTHQVNITALTGVYPASGELVFIRVGDTGVEVLGRTVTD